MSNLFHNNENISHNLKASLRKILNYPYLGEATQITDWIGYSTEKIYKASLSLPNLDSLGNFLSSIMIQLRMGSLLSADLNSLVLCPKCNTPYTLDHWLYQCNFGSLLALHQELSKILNLPIIICREKNFSNLLPCISLRGL